MTSTWMTRAPASITSASWAPRREKSAERIEGATPGDSISSRIRSLMVPATYPAGRPANRASGGAQYRGAAGVALQVLGLAHPGDRPVLAAVRALRDQLEAAEAADAAQPSGQLGGPQPGLPAAGTGGAVEDAATAESGLGRLAHRLIIPVQAGDEEAGGAIAVGAQLQAAGLGRRGQLRRQGAEFLEAQRRRLSRRRGGEQRGDPLLVLA